MTKIKLLMGGEFDSEICKYFCIDKYFYDSIENNYLWFSDPKNFNDPYDLNIEIDVSQYSREELINFFQEQKEKRSLEGDRYAIEMDVNKKVNEIINNPTRYQSSMKKYYENNIVPEYGVCCFSQNEWSLLMWSHYANKHSGICLKFDTEKDIYFFHVPYKVDYPENYPKFDFLKQRKIKEEYTTQVLLASKSRDWQYENEIRIIKSRMQHGTFRGKIKYSKECLKEVIFGYKTTDSFISEIRKLFINNDYNCIFSKMDLKKFEFGLEKFEIK